jgi:hypothetical protein
MSRINNPAAGIDAPAVNPGSSNPHSPAPGVAESFRPRNLTPSQHPALRGLTPAGLAEAARLAAVKPIRPVR